MVNNVRKTLSMSLSHIVIVNFAIVPVFIVRKYLLTHDIAKKTQSDTLI